MKTQPKRRKESNEWKEGRKGGMGGMGGMGGGREGGTLTYSGIADSGF